MLISSKKRGAQSKDDMGKRRNAGEERPLLKVKLPPFKKKVTKDDTTLARWTLEAAKATKSSDRKKGAPCNGAGADSAGRDGSFFSQRPKSKPINKKACQMQNKNVKLTVLRTIFQMLEENRIIRERLSALSQTKAVVTACNDPQPKVDYL